MASRPHGLWNEKLSFGSIFDKCGDMVRISNLKTRRIERKNAVRKLT